VTAILFKYRLCCATRQIHQILLVNIAQISLFLFIETQKRIDLSNMAASEKQQNPSFVLRAIKDVVFEDRPKPQLRDQHDVLVHVAQTGICGSDVSKASLIVFADIRI
jgi:hypothetical protein